MKKLVMFLGVLALAVVAVAFYRNWVDVGVTSTESDSAQDITVNVKVDKEKVKQDTDLAKEKGKEIADKTAAAARNLAEDTQEGAAELGAEFQESVSTPDNEKDGAPDSSGTR